MSDKSIGYIAGTVTGIFFELFLIYQAFTHAHWSVATVCALFLINMRIEKIVRYLNEK